jgi:predicted alpha/beta superfamily hydrolase
MKSIKKSQLLSSFILDFLFISLNIAQDTTQPIVIGQRVVIHSDILDEDRTIWIHTPTGYNNSGVKYPVVYVLDGPAHFHHTTGIIDFLSRLNRIPQMILVAIANTDRTRDLTPPTETDTANTFPTSGGADNFLHFISEELAPYVDENYRTESFKFLIGHSFGGLFAIHALLTKPDFFRGYISISPSLWWNNQALLRDMDSLLEKRPSFDRFLYVTLGNEGGNMLSSAQEFEQLLEKKSPPEFDWTFKLMEEETHGSIPHRTIYLALEKLYSGWRIENPGEILDAGGIEAVDQHYRDLSKTYGYTIVTPENIINQLGYRYIGRKDYSSAIRLFKRNVESFPNSANVYDSLGDGYDANNQPEMALKNYRKAVEISEAIAHPNLAIYRANLERLQEKLNKN